jgi:hypothetical protein
MPYSALRFRADSTDRYEPLLHRKDTFRILLYAPNLTADRAFALAASSSRFFGGAAVWSDSNNRLEAAATSSIAAIKASSFAFDGLVKPLIFRTN